MRAPDSHAARFADLLIALAQCLEQPEPHRALASLRALIDEKRSEMTELSAHLQQQMVELDEQQRQALLARHEDDIRLAMQRFARAQQSFRGRASPAQSVELSELLNTLR